MFIPLCKADAAQRLVYGRLDETPDRSGEVFDYATSKPMFETWSAEMQKASGGKNFGNVRAMHGNIAAGRLETIHYDDAARAIELCARIVDDAEWAKVQEGVYTGFSPGGRYAKRWRDGDHTRYTAEPGEISIVDVPCIPSASFTLVKADGLAEERPFRVEDGRDDANEDPRDALTKALALAATPDDWRATVMAAPAAAIDGLIAKPDALADDGMMAKRHWSAAARREAAKEGHALPDGSFPIANKADVEDAVTAYGQARDQDLAKAHIAARAKTLDATDHLPPDWPGSTARKEKPKENLAKGLGAVSDLAGLLQALTGLAQRVTAEAAAEADGSALPGRLAAWLSEGADILTAMAGEESDEAASALRAAVAALPAADDMAQAAKTGDLAKADLAKDALAKAGARHSKADQERLQSIHDHAVLMGAACDGPPAEKAFGADTLIKLTADLAGTRDALTKAADAAAVLKKRVAELEAQPAEGKAALKALAKGDDGGGGESEADVLAKIAALPERQQTVELIKLAQQKPTRLF